eukprot:TRINITY_DN1007_c2_g1_i1.p2 TRINITY_DN1007_c2_g1~~TRINITY_DN1007_c2_g1_i1.p2  ORF type:complete len:161 (+),score=24.43 TRINITY_DN1007_c2_g1_i1:195-677(+)
MRRSPVSSSKSATLKYIRIQRTNQTAVQLHAPRMRPLWWSRASRLVQHRGKSPPGAERCHRARNERSRPLRQRRRICVPATLCARAAAAAAALVAAADGGVASRTRLRKAAQRSRGPPRQCHSAPPPPPLPVPPVFEQLKYESEMVPALDVAVAPPCTLR